MNEKLGGFAEFLMFSINWKIIYSEMSRIYRLKAEIFSKIASKIAAVHLLLCDKLISAKK